MKKTTAFLLVAMFIISLMPLAVFADEDSEASRGTTTCPQITAPSPDFCKDGKTVAKYDKGCAVGYECARLDDDEMTEVKIKIEQRDRLTETRLKTEERLKKIQGLDKAQIERLSKLEIKNLEKIEQLKKERLEKLAELSEEKLKRIAELEKLQLEKISDLSETELVRLSTLNRAELKELAKKDNAKIKAELKAIQIIKVKDADELNRRALTQARVQLARQNFEDAEDELHDSKEKLDDAKEKLKDAKTDEEKLQHAKEYVIKAADVMISHLEKIKAKIQESENIDETMAAQLVAEIDPQISEINGIKAKAEAASTKEQLKDVAKQLRVKWAKLKFIARLHAEKVVSARVEGIVNRGIVLEKKLDHILAKAEEKGIEVNVSAEISQFSEKIALAKDKYAEAQAKISAVISLKAGNATNDQIKAAADEANSLLKEARDALKEAHEILKTIVSNIKQADPEADLSEEIEVEVATETTSTLVATSSATGTTTETEVEIESETESEVEAEDVTSSGQTVPGSTVSDTVVETSTDTGSASSGASTNVGVTAST